MSRSRRQWSTLKAVIRRKLRETVAATSYWSDTDLLDYWNEAMDMRTMELDEQHEGWCTDVLTTSIVANQREYSWPEGTGRVRKVWLIHSVSSNEKYRYRIIRDEQSHEDVIALAPFEVGIFGVRPTYRMVGELLLLEPPPTRAVTNGLEIEVDNASIYFDEDTDKLDLRYPVQMENLLIFDVVEAALAVESQQGNLPDPNSITRFQRMHLAYQETFKSWTAVRALSPTYGRSFSWGG